MDGPTNVFQIGSGKPLADMTNGPVSQEVIQGLEKLLEDARNGKLQALAFIAIDGNLAMWPGWAGGSKIAPASMVGAIEILKNLFMRDHRLV